MVPPSGRLPLINFENCRLSPPSGLAGGITFVPPSPSERKLFLRWFNLSACLLPPDLLGGPLLSDKYGPPPSLSHRSALKTVSTQDMVCLHVSLDPPSRLAGAHYCLTNMIPPPPPPLSRSLPFINLFMWSSHLVGGRGGLDKYYYNVM